MKYLLSFILFIAFAFSAKSQILFENAEVGPDTLSASETVRHYIGGTTWATAYGLEKNFGVAIGIRSDSLTGSTGAIYVIEGCADPACTFPVPLDTFTADGAAAQYFSFVDDTADWYKYAVRGTATGTQTTKFQTVYAVRRKDR